MGGTPFSRCCATFTSLAAKPFPEVPRRSARPLLRQGRGGGGLGGGGVVGGKGWSWWGVVLVVLVLVLLLLLCGDSETRGISRQPQSGCLYP